MVQYKVIRFDLKPKYMDQKEKDGVTVLENKLNELAKEGYRVIHIVEESEGLMSRKAAILEKIVE